MHKRHKNITRSEVIVLCVFVSVLFSAYCKELNAQPADKHSYKIDLKIDFEHLTYSGTERVRWFNRAEKPTSIIYFHLYPNLRTGDQSIATTTPETDEPRLDIVEVRAGSDDSLLFSSVDDQGTTLRVNLGEQV